MTQRPPIPNPPYTGGCLCGAVRYTLSAWPLAVNACHCNDCKKTSGATNVLMLIADAAAFSARAAAWRCSAAVSFSAAAVIASRCFSDRVAWFSALAARAAA